jgi:hypothetical protein
MLDGAILKAGETRADPSGERAYEQALVWAATNAQGVTFAWRQWRGAVTERLEPAE